MKYNGVILLYSAQNSQVDRTEEEDESKLAEDATY